MARISITSQKRTAVRRSAVRPGQVFKLQNSDGTLGKKRYMAIGSNGKMLSLNIDSHALASTKNANKQVVVIGSATIVPHVQSSWDFRETTRARLAVGQLFENSKGNRFFALGRLGGKNASINMAHALNGDYAVNSDDSAQVRVIGNGEVRVTLAA